MKWALLIVFLLLAAASVEFNALRNLAEADCHTAHALADHAPVAATWITEAAAEPFLGTGALEGAPAAAISAFRSHARSITSELSARLLPVSLVEALRRVELSAEGAPLSEALLALPPAAAASPCRKPAASGAGPLNAQMLEAERTWLERKAQVPLDKALFEHDREIFCKGDKLIASLRVVAESAAKKCAAAKPGSKLAANCAGGGGAVEAEIRDVEQEKELNLRKLRQKWPARVVAGLRC